MPEGFVHVPLNDIDALDAALDDTVAAVLLEVVQGEGGVWPADRGVPRGGRANVSRARRAAHARRGPDGVLPHGSRLRPPGVRHDAGRRHACQGDGQRPARSARSSRATRSPRRSQPGDHGSTFGGGPVVVCGRARDDRRARGRAARRERVSDAGRRSARDCTRSASDRRDRPRCVVPASWSACTLEHAGRPATSRGTCSRAGIVVNHIGADILRFLPPLVCGTLRD